MISMVYISRVIAIIFGLLWLALVTSGLFLVQAQSSGEVPPEYYQNYQISDDFLEMTDTLSTIEATIEVGQEPSADLFASLNQNFSQVFAFFPKDPRSTQIYKQCDLITARLSQWYSSSAFSTFNNDCFGDIKSIISAVPEVKPSIRAKPTSWSSPLVVTFDATASTDPSDDTIPSDNFFWYYKDVFGIERPMGTGPVITHTFAEPGKHVVHLTVRSSNVQSEWVFDGATSIDINVAPKAAEVVVYLNGKLLTTDQTLKIDSQEAKNGFVINGAATNPLGERQILSHTWTIKGNQQRDPFQFVDEVDGPPGQFAIQFPYNGVYTIELDILDNENNKLKETYKVSVSDPVALIRTTPDKWTTSTEFTFDASASYSITSRLSKYQRSIIDPSGNKIENLEQRDFRRKLVQPGLYTIELIVTDELWNQSVDIQKFDVASTDPLPSFVVTPMSERDQPSQFVLDARGSFDEDVRNGVDELTYSWTFSDPSALQINKSVENGERIIATFDKIGDHKVKLTVRDQYGKSAEVEKKISVTSTLRPELFVNPVTTTRGEEVSLTAKTNKTIWFYDWEFGDGTDVSLTTDGATTTHTYQQAGIYDVTLTVATADNGEQNSVTRSVFVWQKDEPTIAYELRSGADEYYIQDATCEWNPAYAVKRYETFQFALSDSINAKGEKTWLEYFIQPKNEAKNKTINKNSLNYNFDELGCQYLDVTIQDKDTAKSVQEKVWFEVTNNPPELTNVSIDFPQSNTQSQSVSIWAWLQASPQRQVDFGIDRIDPLMVKVSAKWARDTDGQITRFSRYYYNTKDPEEKLNIGITPANVTSYTFTVPRVAGEYAFGVEMTDNDGEVVVSEELLWSGPVVTFTQQGNPDLPTMDLDVSTTDISVWEEVIFTMSSSVLSNRSDYDTTRYYKIDLDGDGIYDTPPLKQSSYSHTYDKAGTYTPKAKVVYRERVGIDIAPNINVTQWVKHQVIIDSYDKFALIKNTSIGDLDSQLLCLDVQNCPRGSEFLLDDPDVELVEYPDYGTYQLRLISIDKLGNRPIPYTPTIDLVPGEEEFYLLSVPQAQQVWSGVQLSVWSALEKTISMYPVYTGEGNCSIDLDIVVDSDWDGDPLFDADVPCNELSTQQFAGTKKTIRWNIYVSAGGKLTTTPLTITILDSTNAEAVEVDIPAQYQESYNRIEDLISDVENDIVQDTDGYYFVLLENLRQSLTETGERNSILLQLHDYVNNNRITLPADHRDKLDILILTLTDETLQWALWGTEYDKAKANILARFANTTKENLRDEFLQLEASVGNKDAIKIQMDKIWALSQEALLAGDIDEIDFNDVIKNLCTISFYYDVPTKTCGNLPQEVWDDGDIVGGDSDDIDASDTDSSSGRGWFSGVIKRVIIWVIILILIFVVIVVLFAIRAKKQAGGLDEDEE